MIFRVGYATREEHRKIGLTVVATTNHYTGFGPRIANILRKILALSEAAQIVP